MTTWKNPQESLYITIAYKIPNLIDATITALSIDVLGNKFLEKYQFILDDLRKYLTNAENARTSRSKLLQDNIIILHVYYNKFMDKISIEQKESHLISIFSDSCAIWSLLIGTSIYDIIYFFTLAISMIIKHLNMLMEQVLFVVSKIRILRSLFK